MALASAVNRLGARFDESRILTDDFADVFEDAMESAATRRGLEKRRFYAAALASTLTDDALSGARLERLMACLDEVRPSHLWLLALVVNDLATQHTSGSVVGPRTGVFVALPGNVDEDLIRRDWEDLTRLGCLEPAHEPVQHAGGAPFLRATLGAFGREFADYIHLLNQEAEFVDG